MKTVFNRSKQRKQRKWVQALPASVISVISCSIFLLFTVGCARLSPGTAANPSPYGGVSASGELKTPDRILYDADFAIATAYDALHAFVKWEYDNRQALVGTPEIKQAADKIRAGAPAWFRSAVAVRDAYAVNPSADNRTALQRALDTLQQAIVEANKYRTAQPLTP